MQNSFLPFFVEPFSQLENIGITGEFNLQLFSKKLVQYLHVIIKQWPYDEMNTKTYDTLLSIGFDCNNNYATDIFWQSNLLRIVIMN